MSIKCVLFDFGNTLISIELDWETVLPRNISSLVQHLNSRGIPAEVERFGKTFVANKSSNHSRGQSVMMEYPTTQTLADTLKEFDLPSLSAAELEAAVTAYFQPEESLYPVVPHTHEVLEQLKSSGYKLGIVSNASSGKLIRDAMDHRGFTPYFDSIIVSADVGYRKPHPEIFKLALQELSMSPGDTVMIGDVPAYDVAGPHALGIKTILVTGVDSSEAKKLPSGIAPDAIAASFLEIPAMIKDFV